MKRSAEDVETAAAVSRAATATGLEELARPLLELLQRVTGLESTYLTEIHWNEDVQEILLSHNAGDITVPEGLRVPWEDTLCRRAMASGRREVRDVPSVWPESDAARQLGIVTYVMCPVVTADDRVVGTLCAVSRESRQVAQKHLETMRLFARLIGDHLHHVQEAQAHRARAEAAEARLAERARFLALAEHELKTPLAVITGWADILHRRWPEITSEERLIAVQALEKAAQTLRRQVDRLLQEARGEVLAREMDLVPSDVSEAVREIAAELAGMSRRHPLRVRARGPAWAAVDRGALHQILGHLVENAVKYSPEGGEVVLRVLPGPGGVELEVSDVGVGIPQGVDVFAPFTRGNTSEPGVGLGLHIVRTLVEAMGGTVRARRNVGRGSTFTISLPQRA